MPLDGWRSTKPKPLKAAEFTASTRSSTAWTRSHSGVLSAAALAAASAEKVLAEFGAERSEQAASARNSSERGRKRGMRRKESDHRCGHDTAATGVS